MPDQQFLDQRSAVTYAASLDDLPPAERARRLDTIAAFAAFVGEDPDTWIATVFDEETRKYKRRGFFSEKAKEFAAGYDEPRNAQLQRSNIIRAFFIANGRRLLPEQPDWMTTTSG